MTWDGPTDMSGVGRLSAGANGVCLIIQQASLGWFTWWLGGVPREGVGTWEGS